MKYPSRNKKSWSAALFLALVAGAAAIRAQTIIPPSLLSNRFAPPPRPGKNGPMPGSLSTIASVFNKTGPLAEWGIIKVRPHFSYRLYYSDGVLSAFQGSSETSTMQGISTGVLFEIGHRWTLDYTLSRTFFSNRLYRDTLDHSLNLSGGITLGDLSLGLSQGYQTDSPFLIETGQQSRQRSLSTSISASYPLGLKTVLDASVSQYDRHTTTNIYNAEWQTLNTSSWGLSTLVHYRLSQRLSFGAGIDFAFDEPSEGSSTKSTRPQVTVLWRPTAKLSAAASAGLERRHIDDSTLEDLETTIYTVSAQYQPFDVTSFSLSASKSISPSYFANLVSENTGVSASVSQRFLGRYFLSAGVSEGKTSYIATNNQVFVRRSDDSRSHNVSLSTSFLKRATLSLTYQSSRNFSNQAGFEFENRVYGVETTYRF